jgi:hypothetical protein
MVEQRVNQCFDNHISSCRDEDRDGDDARNGSPEADLLVLQPPDVAASPRKLYWIHSFEM